MNDPISNAVAKPLFRKVLVANRGEIAVRIMRTLREIGVGSAAIFHRVEAGAKHARFADEAHEIKGETPVSAYLDADQIVDVALACNADAIHPGYGFLSENAAFARKVAAAGLTFIGPDAVTINLMGDKISSRNFAVSHGVPVAPSVEAEGDIDAFIEKAVGIGFPLLIKASAGGGGKGMSIVRDASELRERARIAAGEAQRYFSDGRIYAETYVEKPRHIEVQVLGDGKGGAVHLFERECSIQRRFQKIIEEAPAAPLLETTRAAICDAAVRLAAAANYKNAGTVEFILAADGRFFFLEMNTRLQVEHPVTEMICGIDLVKTQIEIAAGLGLPFQQEQVRASGHSLECRICAEDPDSDFMPATGSIRLLRAPSGPHIRFENALDEGQRVTADFDPMLAKLVVWGEDRTTAIDRMIAALCDLTILGIRTNTDYLLRILRTQAFRVGEIHTGFIAERAAELAPVVPDSTTRDRVLIAAALSQRAFQEAIAGVDEPYASIAGWRN